MNVKVGTEELSSPSGGSSGSEFASQDSADEESGSEAGSQIKLQFRSVVLKACWKDEMSMAEITSSKGNLWKSMGINRNGKIYLSIEETLFLVQIGALLLVDDTDTAIPLIEIYTKVAEEKSGCSWESFKVYQHLKSLGYIVGRLGIPWSLKCRRSCTMVGEDTQEIDGKSKAVVSSTFVVQSLKELHLDEVKPYLEDEFWNKLKNTSEESKFIVHLPVYEVYLPNSQFKKTSPGDPNFVIFSVSGHPPSVSDIKELEKRSCGLPLKIGHVDDGRVSLFSFDTAELPVLP